METYLSTLSARIKPHYNNKLIIHINLIVKNVERALMTISHCYLTNEKINK